MADSSHYGKAYINGMLRQLNMMGLLDSIIDIGAGDGTYRKLMGTDLGHEFKWVALEKEDHNNLNEIYNDVYQGNIRTFDFSTAGDFDLALFGSVFEKISKEDSIAAATRCLENCKSYMVSVPISSTETKATKGQWSHKEIMDSFPDIVSYIQHGHIGVYFATNDDELQTFIPILHKKVYELCKRNFPTDQIITG